MSRMVGRSRPAVEGSTSMRFSEVIIIGMVLFGIGMGVRWYINYRQSASYALQQYLGAVKAGEVSAQYALLDEADKRYLPTQKDYAKMTLAHGYTERITKVSLQPEVPDPKDPNQVSVEATVSIRATSVGKELYQTGEDATYTDRFVMHKGSDGKWYVVLSKSIPKGQTELNLQKATPSPESSF